MSIIIKYNEQDITFEYGRTWKHPVTGEKPDINVPPTFFEGVTVEDAPVLEPNPQVEYIPTLTPRQIRLVLNQQGLRSAVENAVAQADQDIKDWWEFSLEYIYDNPILVSIANSLGITEEQRKQIFIAGSTL